jgi:hypothetical protein
MPATRLAGIEATLAVASAGAAASGAGAGLAPSLFFLGALERDANRAPQIGPNADTPVSTILRGFETMAGRRGRQ